MARALQLRASGMRACAWWAALLLAVARARELDPAACSARFDVQRDKIIRTEESREMGARYLAELDVGSRAECLRLCCETDACDVFVFEEKVGGQGRAQVAVPMNPPTAPRSIAYCIMSCRCNTSYDNNVQCLYVFRYWWSDSVVCGVWLWTTKETCHQSFQEPNGVNFFVLSVSIVSNVFTVRSIQTTALNPCTGN